MDKNYVADKMMMFFSIKALLVLDYTIGVSVFFLKWKHDETYSFFTLNYLSRYSDINDQSQSNIFLSRHHHYIRSTSKRKYPKI